MYSSRTMSMEFTPGECVLCFEPDLSKARVLYNAKVMDVLSTKDSKGRRKVEYMVHFQGWNSSWDRVVPENYIIKDSDRNRSLMRRLAEIARHVKKNKSRMRRIDNILKQHFDKRPKFDSDSSSDSSSSEDDKSDDDDDDSDDDSDDSVSGAEGNNKYGPTNGTNGNHGADEDMRTLQLELEDSEYKEIELDLPAKLRRKLEYDCTAINKHEKLVQLPAEPNIITLLEGYVKFFGVNVLCATVEKAKPYTRQDPEGEPPETNIELCKEVMDGLRVFFDFALPTILLYNAEKEQFEKLNSSSRPLVKREHDDTKSALQNSPILPGRRPCNDGTGEPPTKQARLSPRAVVKQEYDDYSDDDDEGPPKRITRKAFAEELRRSSLKSTETVAPKACASENTEANPGVSKRGRNSSVCQTPDSAKRCAKPRGRTISEKSTGKANKQESSAQKGAPTSLSDRISPPPPIPMPSGVSSASSNADTPTSSAMEQSIFRHREQAVNDIFSWKMLPDEEYKRVPTPPSLIYGAHHLLRLFVKLPDYIGRMPFPRGRLKHLVKHLELFIEHLSTRCTELFPDTVYVSAADHKAHR